MSTNLQQGQASCPVHFLEGGCHDAPATDRYRQGMHRHLTRKYFNGREAASSQCVMRSAAGAYTCGAKVLRPSVTSRTSSRRLTFNLRSQEGPLFEQFGNLLRELNFPPPLLLLVLIVLAPLLLLCCARNRSSCWFWSCWGGCMQTGFRFVAAENPPAACAAYARYDSARVNGSRLFVNFRPLQLRPWPGPYSTA